ncbi:Gmad2 immunoglobulin-like domain-containing protein [Streptomyces sp. NPDC047000]|uniref:Gmad2 immunoglobulin-like domain-containing protein n=1 Tax=Streptomyces sp. NPDC047000 TaxID=3155474 RepID=UPI0033C4A106
MSSEHLEPSSLPHGRSTRSAAVLATALTLPLVALAACGTGGTGASSDAPAAPRTTGTPGTPAAGPDGPDGPAGSGGTSTAPSASVAPAPPAATPAVPSPAVRTRTAAVYLLHGEHVSAAPRTVTAPATATGAVRALLAGPNRYERAHGRSTAIPSGTVLRSLTLRRNVATVDLSGRYDDGGGSLSMRARLAQVVFTATRFPDVHRVAFEIDGKPVKAFGGEGIVLDRPVGRADFEDLSPAVLVESPMTGQSVHSPVRVWGSANTFEAVFRLRITDAAGRTAADVGVTATSGTGTRGTFDVTVPYRAVRDGAGLLTAYYLSPKDGRPVTVDTVPLTVRR